MEMPAVLQRMLDAAGRVMGAEQEPFTGGGPGMLGPSLDTKPVVAAPGAPPVNDLVDREMPEAEVRAWWARIEASDRLFKQLGEKWDTLLKAYEPELAMNGAAQDASTVKSMLHFRNLHSKIGHLFYDTPEVILSPREPGPAQNMQPNPLAPPMMEVPGMPPIPTPPISLEDIIATKQAMLQLTLGPEGVDTARLFDELLFDILGWTGIGAYKLGYSCWHRMVPQPVMAPAPFNPLGLGASMPTGEQQMVPVTVHSEYYARRISPKRLVRDVNLRSSRPQLDATFEGMRFQMRLADAIKKFQIEASDLTVSPADPIYYQHTDYEGIDPTDKMVSGVELWVKSLYFVEDEWHPLRIRQLIFLDQLRSRPVVWRHSPDQTIGEDGKLTPDSLEGFPIRVFSIRDLADSAYPKADAAFTNAAVKQLSTMDEQDIMLRDAAIGKYLYDKDAFDEDEIAALKTGKAGRFVGVPGGKMMQGIDKIIGTTPQVTGTIDGSRLRNILNREIDETLGISANQAGASESTVRSATETATIDKAVRGRNHKEQMRVVREFLSLARAMDQLRMRYTDDEEYVQIVGEDGARRMMVWKGKVGLGRYFYDISPDAQASLDSVEAANLNLRVYNMFAKDPNFNRKYWLKRTLRSLGADPSLAVLSDQQALLQVQAQQAIEPMSDHEAAKSGKRPNEPGAQNHREQPGS